MLTRQDETLLVKGDAFLHLDQVIHPFDWSLRRNIQTDGLGCRIQNRDKNLELERTTAYAQHQS
jgi:hypothetical protein